MRSVGAVEVTEEPVDLDCLYEVADRDVPTLSQAVSDRSGQRTEACPQSERNRAIRSSVCSTPPPS